MPHGRQQRPYAPRGGHLSASSLALTISIQLVTRPYHNFVFLCLRNLGRFDLRVATVVEVSNFFAGIAPICTQIGACIGSSTRGERRSAMEYEKTGVSSDDVLRYGAALFEKLYQYPLPFGRELVVFFI